MNKDKKVKIEMCKVINKILIFSIQFLKRIQLNTLEKFGNSLIDNPDKYESLIPNENADKNNQYSKMLQVALETPKNNNIAITGTYGSGKSSFLRTFENKNKEWEYLHISLATFEDNNTSEDDSKEKATIAHGKKEVKEVEVEVEEKSEKEIQNDKLNQLLEKSILQQIFYKEKDKTIPFSRFKRISNIKKWSLLLHSFFIGILLIYTLTIFLPEKVHQFLMCDLNEQIVKFPFMSWIMFFILGFYFYKTFQYLMKLQVSKFNIKSGEIEVNNKDKTSILNEHLDEILYFFEVTSYNVVVIEDLDRFRNTEIFIKLRELNTLINNSKDIGRRVVFVYAIKDDIFKDKDRTKFFDFIIPIIPYINSSSSFVKIKEKFANENIDEEFLRNISLRIDDMRLLINIANEYKIYKHKIGSDKLSKNRLLAMTIYKNFYPSDFAELHVNSGKVYDVFNERTKFIKEEVEKNKKVQLEKSEKISELENKITLEKQKSIEELRMIYILKIFETVNHTSFYANGGTYPLSNLLTISQDDVFNQIKNAGIFAMARGHSTSSFSQIEEAINPNLTYDEREKLIIEHPNEQLEQLKKDLESLKKKENVIKKYNVSQIAKLENSKIFTKIEKEKLLQFLIREGHIREDYYDYISYFFPGSLTLKDKDFVLSVKDDNPQEFEYSLSKIKEVIRNLTSQEFELKAILNYDLLEYMLKHDNTSDRYRNFVSNLTDCSDESKEFVLSFILITQEPKKFIEEIAQRWKKIWLYISREAQLTEDKKDEYFKIFFENLSVENLKLLNIEDSMKDYLESKQQLSKLSSTDNKKFQELMKKLNVEYKNIENPNDNPLLFNFIYENYLYERNEQMINKVILFKDSSYLEEKLKTAHFTSIKNLNFEHLTVYIFDDLNLYIENIFLKIETNTKESEDAIRELLNEDLTIENKQAIIKKEETKISDITAIPTELWDELLKENKLMPTWDNLLHYYKEKKELDDYLLDFLNLKENYKDLVQHKMNNKEVFGNELLQSFSRKILKSNELSDDAYSNLIKSVIWQFGDLNMDSLSSTKVDIILVNKKISLNQTTLNSLKKNSENKQITLIENFKDVFLEKYEELPLDENNYIEIFKSSKFTPDEKNAIIEKLDLSLFENTRLVEIIVGLYLNSDYKIPINLFDKLFEKSDFENALKILTKQIPEFTHDKISDYLNQFESPYIDLTEKTRKHLTLENTQLNMNILKALELKGYIKRVEEVKTNDDKIKVIRKMK